MNSQFQHQVLKEAEVYTNENYPDSYSYQDTTKYTSESNRIIIGQNNLIIALLSSIHKKIDQINTKGKETSVLENLLTDFKNLNLEPKINLNPSTLKPKPEYLVWEPRKNTQK